MNGNLQDAHFKIISISAGDSFSFNTHTGLMFIWYGNARIAIILLTTSTTQLSARVLQVVDEDNYITDKISVSTSNNRVSLTNNNNSASLRVVIITNRSI